MSEKICEICGWRPSYNKDHHCLNQPLSESWKQRAEQAEARVRELEEKRDWHRDKCIEAERLLADLRDSLNPTLLENQKLQAQVERLRKVQDG